VQFVVEQHAGNFVDVGVLFPHLSAVENVAFGLRSRGTDKNAARQRATEALARLGLNGLESARPGSMSGG
jgi:molybdate transport system ATP-binding protein